MTKSQLPYINSTHSRGAHEAIATNSSSYTNWPPCTMRADFSVFAKIPLRTKTLQRCQPEH